MMNLSTPQQQHLRSSGVTRDERTQRSDDVRHMIVNQGISVQSSANTVCAVEYMKSHNVDADIIERVLLHPEQRRR